MRDGVAGIAPDQIEDLRRLEVELERRVGLRIDERVRPMLLYKVRPILRRLHTDRLSDLVWHLTQPEAGVYRDQILGSIVPQETRWFRTPALWRWLREVHLPSLVERSVARRRLRVWSAGCASGEEAYSFALLFSPHLPGSERYASLKLDVFGTDVSVSAIYRAISGTYDQMSLDRGLDGDLAVLRERHFLPQGSAFRIAEEIQDRCHFEVHNLLDDSSALGSFDVILLRNVLTYLSDRARKEILARVARRLAIGGILVPGAAESWKDLGLSLREEVVAGGVRIYRRGIE